MLKAALGSDPELEREARELSTDPNEGWAGYIALARMAQDRGDVSLAVRHYRDSLQRKPSFFAMNNLAVLLAAPGPHQDIDEALRLSADAFEQAGDNIAVIDTRGWILLRAGKTSEAAPLLEEAWHALEALPGAASRDSASVALHLATLRLKQGRVEEAGDLVSGMDRQDLPAEDRPYLDRLREELHRAE
jgi:tetratricopeptide (TPR) repeat protein